MVGGHSASERKVPDGSSGVADALGESLKEEKNDFRDQIVQRYNFFLTNSCLSPGDPVGIYSVPGFEGDWSVVSNVDYYVYNLSVKGLVPQEGHSLVTLAQVAHELELDRERGMEQTAIILNVLSTYHGDRDTRGFKLERNDFIRVSRGRMKQLITNTEFPAAGAFQYGPHSGVLLAMEGNKDAGELSAEIAHEVGHLERSRRGKNDTNGDFKKMRLEEGLVQANARQVADRGRFAGAKTLNEYDFETQIATDLSNKLDISLMEYSHAELRKAMVEQPRWNYQDPYQYLIDNLDVYVRSVNEVGRLGDAINQLRLDELALEFSQAKINLEKLLG